MTIRTTCFPIPLCSAADESDGHYFIRLDLLQVLTPFGKGLILDFQQKQAASRCLDSWGLRVPRVWLGTAVLLPLCQGHIARPLWRPRSPVCRPLSAPFLSASRFHPQICRLPCILMGVPGGKEPICQCRRHERHGFDP